MVPLDKQLEFIKLITRVNTKYFHKVNFYYNEKNKKYGFCYNGNWVEQHSLEDAILDIMEVLVEEGFSHNEITTLQLLMEEQYD